MEDFHALSSGRHPVEELAVEFLERRRRGETPLVSEYEDRHPALAGEIRRFFSAIVAMEGLAGEGGRATSGRGEPDPSPLATHRRLGELRIVREVGKGGMGVVYEAFQESLERRVALKVLPFHGLLDERSLQRFRVEAQAAARLHHPGIVPVFGIGEHDGLHYYTMQLIDGVSLADVIADLRELVSRHGPSRTWARSSWEELFRAAPENGPPALALLRHAMLRGSKPTGARGCGSEYWSCIARLGSSAASALAYAHAEDVLHRDVKPSNLLLDAEGNLWLADFGLAKIQGSTDVTGAGDIVGTLRYLAPERLKGWADPRSDVYSLGLTLYELLTLHAPFDDVDRGRLLRRIVEEEPPRPRKLVREIPRDLETIVLKCIAKEPGQRYTTAGMLHEDLQRFLRGEPIQARLTNTLERSLKWARRRPAAAGLAAVIPAALLLLLAGALWYNARLSESARNEKEHGRIASAREVEARNARALAEQREATANRYLYGAHMNLGVQAWDRGLTSRMVALLKRHLPAAGAPDHRGFEWYYLWRQAHGESAVFRGHTGAVLALAYSPDGQRLASGGEDKSVRVWSLKTGRLEQYYEEHRDRIQALAFSPDGKTLAAGSGDGDKTVSLWDLEAGRVRARFLQHVEGVSGVAFSPDGALAASSSQDWTVRFWDPQTGEEKLCYRVHAVPVRSIAFSPRRATVAAGYRDGRVRVLEAPSGKVLATLGPLDASAAAVVFSPDGDFLAACSMQEATPLGPGEIRVWDAVRFVEKAALTARDGAAITSLAFSPDGSTLASGGFDRLVRLWDWAAGTQRKPLRGVLGTVFAIACSASSGQLAAGDFSALVKLWSPSVLAETDTFRQHSGEVMSVAFSPDGKRAISASRDRTARIWDLEHGGEWAVLEGHGHDVLSACFSPDGLLAATGSMDQSVRLWDAHSGRLQRVFRGHAGIVLHVRFSADGTALATSGSDRLIKLWDPATGEELAILRGHSQEVRCLAFQPHFGGLASVSGDWGDRDAPGELKLWDLALRKERFSVPHAHSMLVSCVAFSPDGKLLATGGLDHKIRLWDASNGEGRRELTGHSMGVTGIAFFPGGESLVSVSWDRTVKVWDLETLEERATFQQDLGALIGVAVSPDGSTVLACGGGIKVLRADLPAAVEERLRDEAVWNSTVTAGESAAAAALSGRARPSRELPADPQHKAWVHQRAALAFEQRGSVEQAIGEHVLAIEVDAGFVPAARSLARLLLEGAQGSLGRTAPHVIGAVDRVLAAGRADSKLLHALAATLLTEPTADFSREALKYATLAADMTLQRDVPVLLTLAAAQMKNRRPVDAVLTLEAAWRHAPSDHRILERLARCREASRPDFPSYGSVDAALTGGGSVLIPEGAVWKLFKGTVEPSPALEWTQETFDDAAWDSGASGFGFADGDDATVLADMSGKYTTVYLRCAFDAPEPASASRAVLEVSADDGFVAYLNGKEVARLRAGEPGTRIAPGGTADGPAPEPLAVHTTVIAEALRPGRNVLAIQGLNASLDSSDFTLIPVLKLLSADEATAARQVVASFRAVAQGEDAARRVAYFEGRILARERRHEEAAQKLLEAAAGETLHPHPHLWLAEALRAAGEPARAESHLRAVLGSGLRDADALWELWFLVARVDLHLGAAEILARLPGTWQEGERYGVAARADMIWVLESLRSGGAVRINCGGDAYADPRGVAWGKDRFFPPCSLASRRERGETYLFSEERFSGEIEGTENDLLYHDERWFPRETCKDAGYRIPLPTGRYRVTFHSAEIALTPKGARSFDVELEGVRVLAGYEPRAVGMATADWKSFETTVADGILDIVLLHRVENPDVSGIEVERLE